ncbi:YoaK family protein [Paraburkholderia caballeronis]|uniref:Uncharacterized membrane protein YoaK, UPF0700 family n=1 Tax=Paraburkholderia caballeronis TaxID=416943 RepID=A0A1H7L523_9BURK|nr:YoaK family protein [Paraburkholderia caballeronis]PXW28297.1 uncharacterized membrane protein YoaK (UPF0700 family) [Paraburkholderia caballeronis]PXX03663.1 uncharacterized membrane protein YoaK (UPF0700 family) [Paraburkholderia caballeronis]RAK04407.1 uncharacterized membrane protein YoaK (UPF0700 family) [Paraburkholderia caballeronis]SED81403.1 Uncharacterized membrane protein YoaK, UPF0700 family [Paraburkholderia caballeronis]SEK94092.1 Uncharacterized membrane protein YoaK, UPF0700
MKLEGGVLAMIAGYVDALGFIALSGVFTAHVTGNFILIGAALGGAGNGILLKLSTLPAFVAGVLLAAALAHLTRAGGTARTSSMLYLVQALGLVAFAAAGIAATPLAELSSLSALLCAMLGALAMGMQNAHDRVVGRRGVPNTVMTGNVTQAVLDLASIVRGGAAPRERMRARQRLAETVLALLCFALGAVAGALLFGWASFWALALPGAALAVLAGLARGEGARSAGGAGG